VLRSFNTWKSLISACFGFTGFALGLAFFAYFIEYVFPIGCHTDPVGFVLQVVMVKADSGFFFGRNDSYLQGVLGEVMVFSTRL